MQSPLDEGVGRREGRVQLMREASPLAALRSLGRQHGGEQQHGRAEEKAVAGRAAAADALLQLGDFRVELVWNGGRWREMSDGR